MKSTVDYIEFEVNQNLIGVVGSLILLESARFDSGQTGVLIFDHMF
jgi:hypothetical protein